MKVTWFCLLLLMGGCVGHSSPPPVTQPVAPPAPLPPIEPEKVIVNVTSEVDAVLKHADAATKLRGADLLSEYESVRQQYKSGQDEMSRNKLALMLLIPYASFHDENAALNLLAPYVQDKNLQTSNLRSFSLLIYNFILERRRAEDGFRSQLQKSRDDHRHAEEVLQQKVKDERERADLLQKKLDALLELERNLSGRDANTTRKP